MSITKTDQNPIVQIMIGFPLFDLILERIYVRYTSLILFRILIRK